VQVQFRSAKEKAPQQESEMDVLYGPGKRAAFRLRWYLIVFLVTLPLMLIVYNIGKSMVLLESGGKLVIPTYEIFSQTAGRVERIEAKEGEVVDASTPLLFLSNLTLTTRLAELSRLSSLGAYQNPGEVFPQLERLLQQQVGEASLWDRKVKQLASQGVVTQLELKQASDQLLNANRALLETRLRKQQWEVDRLQRQKEEVTQEEMLLAEEQVKSLTVSTREAVKVIDVYVRPDQWVDQGEPIARVSNAKSIQIWLYVDLQLAEHARTGEQFTVILPNGDHYPAQIIKGAERALKVPNELREAFSGNKPGLLALAEFKAPLDTVWQIEQLPIRARFTPRWLQRVFGKSK
jgi:multidrug efflux pump subunit AcrA (membrane-fusion protein)